MSTRLALLAATVAACRSSGAPGVAEARADEVAPAAGGVAVVELFTSEGCSSCPPADWLLADLARDGASVYALAFHVDYWDGLGWPNPFASADWTARQEAYARAFGVRGLYTPQMVVQGTDAFNGTDEDRARSDIARSLAKQAPVRLSLRARGAGPQTVAVEVDAPGAPARATVDVAVVQREATTAVRAGENAGRTLHHVDVVRAWATATVSSSPLTLHLPASLRRVDGEIIAVVQGPPGGSGGMPVLGAARAALPE